ncbi:hypothetical protein D3C81_1741170 [compost metagenome]
MVSQFKQHSDCIRILIVVDALLHQRCNEVIERMPWYLRAVQRALLHVPNTTHYFPGPIKIITLSLTKTDDTRSDAGNCALYSMISYIKSHREHVVRILLLSKCHRAGQLHARLQNVLFQ